MQNITNKKNFSSILFENLQSPKLVDLILAILYAESEDTLISYKFYHQEDSIALAIVLKNDVEDFSHLHYFYMDSIDKKFDEYLYLSMPLSNLKMLIEQSTDWFTTDSVI